MQAQKAGLKKKCFFQKDVYTGDLNAVGKAKIHTKIQVCYMQVVLLLYIYMYVFFLLLLCLKTICFLNSSSVSHSTSSKTTTLFVFICFYLAVFSLFPHPCSFSLPLLQFTSLPCPSPQHYFLSSYTSGSNFRYFFSCLIFEIFPFTFTYSFLYVYLS